MRGWEPIIFGTRRRAFVLAVFLLAAPALSGCGPLLWFAFTAEQCAGDLPGYKC